jgi:hypothetical protein
VLSLLGRYGVKYGLPATVVWQGGRKVQAGIKSLSAGDYIGAVGAFGSAGIDLIGLVALVKDMHLFGRAAAAESIEAPELVVPEGEVGGAAVPDVPPVQPPKTVPLTEPGEVSGANAKTISEPRAIGDAGWQEIPASEQQVPPAPEGTSVPRGPVEQGRNPQGKFLPKTGGELVPGSLAEEATWEAIKNKPGWRVVEGRVTVRDAKGQTRIYDGAAISPNGHVIGLEVKSGSGTKTAAQREFDKRVNAGNAVQGVGQHSDLVIERVIEIKK